MTARMLVLLPLLAACGERQAAPPRPVVPTREATLADGATLTVPARPARVLPANSAAFDLVAALLESDRVAAIPSPARHWSVVAAESERWSRTPEMERFTGEAVLALAPDLMVTSSWSDPEPIEAAHAAEIPVVELPDAESWEDLVDAARLLGEVLNEQERAADFVEALETRRAALARADRPRLRVLPYANFGSGGTTSGARTTLDLAITLAGFENAAAAAGLESHASVGLEQVLTIDPDLFLTASQRDGVTAGANFLRGEEVLSELRAIREDRIAVLPAELFSASSHRVLDAAEALAAAVDALFAD